MASQTKFSNILQASVGSKDMALRPSRNRAHSIDGTGAGRQVMPRIAGPPTSTHGHRPPSHMALLNGTSGGSSSHLPNPGSGLPGFGYMGPGPYGGNAFNDAGMGVPFPPNDQLLHSTLYGIKQLLEKQQAGLGQQNFSKAFIQDRTDAHEAFKHFPPALQKEIKSRTFTLKDDLAKLYKLKSAADQRLAKPKILHKTTQKLAKMQFQVTKAELKQTYPFNIAAEFDKFRREIAERHQKFVDDARSQSIHVFSQNTNAEVVSREIQEIVQAFTSGQQEAYSFQNQLRLVNVVSEWLPLEYQEIRGKAEREK